MYPHRPDGTDPSRHGEDPADEFLHEQTIEVALVAALRDDIDLAESGEEAGLAPLNDDDGDPVTVTGACIYRDAGVLSGNRGAVLDLSDGSQFQITIVRSGNPRS